MSVCGFSFADTIDASDIYVYGNYFGVVNSDMYQILDTGN